MRWIGMGITAFNTTLYRIDPARNMSRFYTLSVQPNLFGGHSVLRSWGRIGSGGRLRVDFYNDETAAGVARDRLVTAKRKRGYADRE